MTRKRVGGFTLVELLVVIVIIAILAALLLPALTKAICNGRQGAMTSLINGIYTAAKSYEVELNAYPPNAGGGYDSAPLALGLKTQGPKKMAYFEFQPDMLDTAGNIKSQIHDWDVLRYRNNAINSPANQSDATAHNKTSLDLWCTDCNGSQTNPNQNINNWGE